MDDDAETKVASPDEPTASHAKDASSSYSSGTLLDPMVAEDATSEYAVRIGGERAKLSFPLHSPTARTLSGGQVRCPFPPSRSPPVWKQSTVVHEVPTDIFFLCPTSGNASPSRKASSNQRRTSSYGTNPVQPLTRPPKQPSLTRSSTSEAA